MARKEQLQQAVIATKLLLLSSSINKLQRDLYHKKARNNAGKKEAERDEKAKGAGDCNSEVISLSSSAIFK